MGYNSTRRYRGGKHTDIVVLVAGVVIILGLLAYGFGLVG